MLTEAFQKYAQSYIFRLQKFQTTPTNSLSPLQMIYAVMATMDQTVCRVSLVARQEGARLQGVENVNRVVQTVTTASSVTRAVLETVLFATAGVAPVPSATPGSLDILVADDVLQTVLHVIAIVENV